MFSLYIRDETTQAKVLITVTETRRTQAFPHRFETPNQICAACYGQDGPEPDQSCYCTPKLWAQLSDSQWTQMVLRQNQQRSWILQYFKGKV